MKNLKEAMDKKKVIMVRFDKLTSKEDGFLLKGKTKEGDVVFMKPENLSDRFKEGEMPDSKRSYFLAGYLGRPMRVNVLSVKGKEAEVSAKEVVLESVENLAKTIKEDPEKKYKATVVRTTINGAMMLILDVECFMPNRAFSEQKSVFAKDFLNPGDKVDVKIASIKGTRVLVEATKKFEVKQEEYKAFKEDEIVVGKIVEIREFGAFVQIEKGIDAICSIPESVYDTLSEGDTVTIRIININEEKRSVRAKFMFKHAE